MAFDHLGSGGAHFDGGTLVSGSLTRFDPIGNFRGTRRAPAPTRRTTGIRATSDVIIAHDNTGPDLGLIYEQPQVANARTYLPEVGRFTSPDMVIPDPERPQSLPTPLVCAPLFDHNPNTW